MFSTTHASADSLMTLAPASKPLASAMARALPGGLLLAAGLLLTPTVMAATYQVSNTNDSGAGSLRDAVDQANTSVGVADVITFTSTVSGTIALTSGNLQVTDPVAIQGPGAAILTVSGAGIGVSLTMGNSATTMAVGGSGGVFSFGTPYSGNSPALQGGGAMATMAATASSISGLTITGGYAIDGGGINAYNVDLTIDHCVVTGNSAAQHGGGISSSSDYSTLTILDSVISNNVADYAGGGVASGSSAITIERSTINNNTVTSANYYGGGGIYIHNDNDNVLTLDASTVTDNHSNSKAGGIFIRHTGASISNSTITNNTAANSGGGIYLHASPSYYALNIANSTITGNSAASGGGVALVYDSGSASIRHSVIASNLATTGPDLYTENTSVFVIDHSLVKDAGAATITDNGGNIFATDPLLGPLQNNGGPTLTRLPLTGSPLIDAGDPAFTGPPNTDQRGTGFARIVNGVIDIGATEFAVAAPPVITQTVPVPGLDDAGKLGLGLLLGLAGLAVARRRRDPLERLNPH